MYCTTLNTTGKKLEVDIKSIDKMISTVSIPFYFHQALTQMFLFMLLKTNHATSLRSRMSFIPKPKEFQILFTNQRQKQKLESRVKTPSLSELGYETIVALSNQSEMFLNAFISTVKASVITMEK